MIWDVENVFSWAVVFMFLVLYLWAKWRSRRSLGWSDAKARAFAALWFCLGFSLLGLFEGAAEFVAPANIEGAVSRVELQPSGKLDRSNFEITSLDGRSARIASGHDLVRQLETGERVDVVYNPWTSSPYNIRVFDGAASGVLLREDQHDVLRWVVFFVAVLAAARYLRRFLSADAES